MNHIFLISEDAPPPPEDHFLTQELLLEESIFAPPTFENPRDAPIWMEQARKNFEAAQLLAKNNFVVYALFHYQQTLEMCLKSIEVFQGHQIRMNHRLQYLVNQHPTLGDVLQTHTISLLEEVYVKGRYPKGDGVPFMKYNDCDVHRIAREVEQALVEMERLLEEKLRPNKDLEM